MGPTVLTTANVTTIGIIIHTVAITIDTEHMVTESAAVYAPFDALIAIAECG